MTEFVKEELISTIGGRVRCKRCQAKAKRTQQQCLLPAITGKRVCRVHGGRSRGPATKEGRERCRAAKLIHGRETRKIRNERQQTLAELKVMQRLGKLVDIF